MNFANVSGLMIPVNGVNKEVLSITDSLNRVIWQKNTIDYSEPFWIEALDGGDINIVDACTMQGIPPVFLIYYSFDGENWDYETTDNLPISIPVNNGYKVWFFVDQYEDNQAWWYKADMNGEYRVKFEIDMDVNVGGNIMSLVSNVWDLPTYYSEILVNNALRGVFEDCTIVSAEDLILPATTLSNSCYKQMFKNCSNLTTPPQSLPASVVSQYAYAEMFSGCASLTKSPDILCSEIGTRGCEQMFYGCSSLNQIKCLAETLGSYAVSNWVDGVVGSGTFRKKTSMSGWDTGVSGIPSGWTVVNV